MFKVHLSTLKFTYQSLIFDECVINTLNYSWQLHFVRGKLTFIMVLPLMTQVMLAGGLLLEVTQDMWTVSPPLASRVPDTVTRSGPTETHVEQTYTQSCS